MATAKRANQTFTTAPATASLHVGGSDVRLNPGRTASSPDSDAFANPRISDSHGVRKEPRLIDPDVPKPLPSKIGRRSAPRLRLSLPGQLIAVEKVHQCIVLNLSRSGAQVAILDALREGEGAILRCGLIDHFAVVTRSEFGLNALQFEEPLTDAQVIEVRHLYENFEERERRALIETARQWVSGDTDDDRPI